MATVESLVEAFARGLARGLVEQASPTPPPRVKRQRRRGPDQLAPPPVVHDSPMIHPNGGREPPVTQAELDHMERVLKGEVPSDMYMPGEGMPVTGPNG